MPRVSILTEYSTIPHYPTLRFTSPHDNIPTASARSGLEA